MTTNTQENRKEDSANISDKDFQEQVNQVLAEPSLSAWQYNTKEEKIKLALEILSQPKFFEELVWQPLVTQRNLNDINIKDIEDFLDFVEDEMLWQGHNVKHNYTSNVQIDCSLEWMLAQSELTYKCILLNTDYSKIVLPTLLHSYVLPNGNKLPSIAEILSTRGIIESSILLESNVTITFIDALKQSMQDSNLNKSLLLINLAKSQTGCSILTDNDFKLLTQLVSVTNKRNKLDNFNIAYSLLKNYMGYQLLIGHDYKLANLLIPNEKPELLMSILELPSKFSTIDNSAIGKLAASEFGCYVLAEDDYKFADLLINKNNIEELIHLLCAHEGGLKILAANNCKLARLIPVILNNKSKQYIEDLYALLNKHEVRKQILSHNNGFVEDAFIFHPNKLAIDEEFSLTGLSLFEEEEEDFISSQAYKKMRL